MVDVLNRRLARKGADSKLHHQIRLEVCGPTKVDSPETGGFGSKASLASFV